MEHLVPKWRSELAPAPLSRAKESDVVSINLRAVDGAELKVQGFQDDFLVLGRGWGAPTMWTAAVGELVVLHYLGNAVSALLDELRTYFKLRTSDSC